MNQTAKPYQPHTECPVCGYAPLHHKHTNYSGERVIVSYRCLVCRHAFDVEHVYRDNQGGWDSDLRPGVAGETAPEEIIGGKGVALDLGPQVLSTSQKDPFYLHVDLDSAPGDLGRKISHLSPEIHAYLPTDYISQPGAKT